MTACFHQGSVEACDACCAACWLVCWARRGPTGREASNISSNPNLTHFTMDPPPELHFQSATRMQTPHLTFTAVRRKAISYELRFCRWHSGSRPFFQGVNCIDRQTLEALQQPAWPSDLYEINLVSRAQAKVYTHVAVRRVAGAATDFVHTHASSGLQADACANAVAIGFCAGSAEGDPVVLSFDLIHQETGVRIHVADHRGEAPVVPQSADGQPAGRRCLSASRPRVSGNVTESSLPAIVVEDLGFLEIASQVLFVHFGVHVSVHQQKIGTGVVIEIEEHRAPSQILRVQSQPRGEGHVIDCAISVIAIERGSVVGKIGAEDVQLAIAIEVGDGASHACLRSSVFVERRAGDYSHISER